MTEATLLLRQIHPSSVKPGRVTSQAFRPTPEDEQKLKASAEARGWPCRADRD